MIFAVSATAEHLALVGPRFVVGEIPRRVQVVEHAKFLFHPLVVLVLPLCLGVLPFLVGNERCTMFIFVAFPLLKTNLVCWL